jgi:hypothetical protein
VKQQAKQCAFFDDAFVEQVEVDVGVDGTKTVDWWEV